MKYGTHCWDNFTSAVEAWYDQTLEEGVHFKVLPSKEVILINKAEEDYQGLMEFYYDSWMTALDTQKL